MRTADVPDMMICRMEKLLLVHKDFPYETCTLQALVEQVIQLGIFNTMLIYVPVSIIRQQRYQQWTNPSYAIPPGLKPLNCDTRMLKHKCKLQL